MLLCFDIGNSHIHGGVYDGDRLCGQFRKSTSPLATSDELGVFFATVLREHDIDPRAVRHTAVCSVVPAVLYSMRSACIKYFRGEPFVLQAGVKTGLRIRYRNPHEVGADRIANAIAATHLHPGQDLIVADFGTATTLEVITATGDYLGGAILPGVGVAVESLASRTAKLPRVEITRPTVALGRTSIESIQSGIYHGHAGAVRQLITELAREAFAGVRPRVLGTGGFARLFEEEKLYDEFAPELVLLGLKRAYEMNRDAGPAAG